MYFSATRLQKQYTESLCGISQVGVPIFFIGMMGCGKTTIGRIISQMLAYNFVDMDLRIEQSEGMKIKKLFIEKGESYFRQKERALTRILTHTTQTVVSCGGGVFAFEGNINAINKKSISIFLNVSPEILEERLVNDKKRPLLLQTKHFSEILQQRMPLYMRAKIVVNITHSEIKTNVVQCIEALYQYSKSISYAKQIG